MGNPKEAMRYSSRAYELNPLHHVISGGHLSNCIFAGEMEMAREVMEHGRVLFDDSFVYHWSSALYYYKKGDLDLAIKSMARSDELNPRIRVVKYTWAYMCAKNNEIEKANTYLDTIPDNSDYYTARASVYAGLGDRTRALSLLNKAADEGVMAYDAKVSIFFESYRDDPDFKAFFARFGL
jgi:tetratricopeptide (TPR) repeat protein